MWNRWTQENVRSLREQHRLTGKRQTSHPSVGDIVIVKEDQKPRNMWRLAVLNN
jgi:hypothetical protein